MAEELSINFMWGVQVEGSCADLIKVRRYLNGSIRTPESHCISMYGDIPMLVTSLWNAHADPDDVYQAAVGDLATIRSMVDLIEGCGELACGTVYDCRGETIQLWRKSNVAVTIAGVQKPAEDFAIMLARVRHKPKIALILNVLTADPAWMDIYRAYEALKDAFGNESGLKKLFPGEGAKIERLRRTANEHRHFDVKGKDPNPMSHSEAIAYIKDLVRRAIASVEPPPYVGPRQFSVRLPEYDMPESGITHLSNLVLSEPSRNRIPLDKQ